MANTKLEDKIARILACITGRRDKIWLAGQLRHAAEPTLEQRIFETLRVLPLGLDMSALRKFAKKCAETRNDISHYGGQRDGENSDKRYADFMLMVHKQSDALSCLYHALILYEIGLDERILKWWFYQGYQSFGFKAILKRAGLLSSEVEVTK